MVHYNFYNIERFKRIRERKIQIHSKKIRNGYRIVLSLLIIFIFAMPYSELIGSDPETDTAILKESFIFNIATLVILVLYYFISSRFLPNKYVEDDEKRLRFFSDNQIKLMVFMIMLVILMIAIYFAVDKIQESAVNESAIDKYYLYIKRASDNVIFFKDTLNIKPNEDIKKTGFYTKYIVNQFILSVFLIWSIGTFTLTFHSIKSRVQRKTGKSFKEDDIFIYWYNFLKSLILENPLILLSVVLFTTLTFSSFVLRGKGDITERHFIYSVAFYSFWFASLTAIVAPFFIKIRTLNNTYYTFASHRLRNAILTSINDHVVIIGLGSLGNQLIENCFYDIHPEGYNADTICPKSDSFITKEIEDVSDYDLIINKELELQLVSRRIVVIEKNAFRFSSSYKVAEDLTIGLFNIAERHKLNISLICVCGDANNNTIMSFGRCEKAQVLVNTTPDSNLSLRLSTAFHDQKLILSVNSATAFEYLTSTTYDRAIFPIDTQQIEGITISQMIFCWGFTNVSNNLFSLWNLSKNPEDFIKKLNEDIKLGKNTDISVIEFKKKLVLNGKNKILIAGNSSYIFYIIQSLWMSLRYILDMKDDEINELIEEKLIILTTDKKIQDELFAGKWNFYPIRDRNTSLQIKYLNKSDSENSNIKISCYIKDILNFDSYLEIFRNNKIGLIVLMNDQPFDAIKMFTEAANSSEVVSNSSKSVIKPPHIIVYSLSSDEIYLNSIFKKYFAFNKNKNEKIGFPTQLMKESRISKDYISSNQIASMLRAIYINKHLENKSDEPIAEIIFSIIEKPGALAYLVSKLCGLELQFGKKQLNIPNFIYYYSTEMNIYRDTFLFKGTASLEKNELDCNNSLEDSIRYCFINCEEKFRSEMENVVANNFGEIFNNQQFKDISNRKYDSGNFTHYPISSILKNPVIYNDILNQRRRLFVSNKNSVYKTCENKKYKDLNPNEILMLFNVANFSVWTEGEESPGSYAGLLANLILGTVSKSAGSLNGLDNYVPEILFSNNRPSSHLDPENQTYKIAQDSFYIKLVKKEVKISDSNKNIRAVKINLASRLITENLEWSDYLFNLKEHLFFAGGEYSFYVIEKIFVEGTIYEGDECFSEISVYKKADHRNEIINPVNDFKVITRKNLNSNSINKNVLEMRIDNDWISFRGNNTSSQEYEMCLIRNDIIEGAKTETYNGKNYGKYQNMIFAIEEL